MFLYYLSLIPTPIYLTSFHTILAHACALPLMYSAYPNALRRTCNDRFTHRKAMNSMVNSIDRTEATSWLQNAAESQSQRRYTITPLSQRNTIRFSGAERRLHQHALWCIIETSMATSTSTTPAAHLLISLLNNENFAHKLGK